jgi:hypothetical protein
MFHPMVATSFENIQEPHQIAFHVSVWVLERIADPGLRREMDDPLGLVSAEQTGHSRRIRQVQLLEIEVGMGRELIQPRLLESDVVVRIQIVQADDFVAPRQKALGHVKADKASNAGDQNLHDSNINSVLPARRHKDGVHGKENRLPGK